MDLQRVEEAMGKTFSECVEGTSNREKYIHDMLLDSGHGSRGIVFGIPKLRPGERIEDVEAHFFNAVNQNGEIRFLCGQIGGKIDPSDFEAFRFMRTK